MSRIRSNTRRSILRKSQKKPKVIILEGNDNERDINRIALEMSIHTPQITPAKYKSILYDSIEVYNKNFQKWWKCNSCGTDDNGMCIPGGWCLYDIIKVKKTI